MLIVDFLVFSQRGDQSAELSGCLIIWSCLGIQTDASGFASEGERQEQPESIQNGVGEVGQADRGPVHSHIGPDPTPQRTGPPPQAQCPP